MQQWQTQLTNLEETSQENIAEKQEAMILRRSDPEVLQALEEFKKLHTEFLNIAYKKLFVAKAAGEILLMVEQSAGFKNHYQLFTWLEVQPDIKISQGTFYGYVNVAERWPELELKAGDQLDSWGWFKAVKILTAKPKKEKATDEPPTPEELPPPGWKGKIIQFPGGEPGTAGNVGPLAAKLNNDQEPKEVVAQKQTEAKVPTETCMFCIVSLSITEQGIIAQCDGDTEVRLKVSKGNNLLEMIGKAIEDLGHVIGQNIMGVLK